jgi:hypothetical protein
MHDHQKAIMRMRKYTVFYDAPDFSPRGINGILIEILREEDSEFDMLMDRYKAVRQEITEAYRGQCNSACESPRKIGREYRDLVERIEECISFARSV